MDTFEEEEQIELNGVAAKLKGLDIEMQATDAKIADFCKQLNIPTPF